MQILKKIFIFLLVTILILLPAIILIGYFFKTFWGPIYSIDISEANIEIIQEVLEKDNIKVENIDKVNKIELCGEGLWDYRSLKFIKKSNTETTYIYETYLYDNEEYHILEYLKNNSLNIDWIFLGSIIVSCATIIISIIYINHKVSL